MTKAVGVHFDLGCGNTGRLISERQQRLALGTGEAAARILTQKKEHKGEDEAETDGEGERNDGHMAWEFADVD